MIAWDKKMEQKVRGKHCVVCCKAVDKNTPDPAHIRTNRKSDIFIHRHFLENREDGEI